MTKSLAFLLLAVVSFGSVAQKRLSGKLLDEQGEPLAFATIGIVGETYGTISNIRGEFDLQIPERFEHDTLIISHMGYEDQSVPIAQIDGPLAISLYPSIMQLDELIIRPLSATEYIQRAVRKIPENYPSDPFETQSYYRELFTENGAFVSLSEAVFQSYYPSYQDTIKNQHQLVLYRQADDLQDLAFMSDWIEKKQLKEKKKADKKGEEYEVEDISKEIREGFGGPDNILTLDLGEDLQHCLDSNNFKKFKYEILNGVSYQGRELLVIAFETKNKVEHTRQVGKIYLDIETDAIVSVELTGELVIPVAIRPLLFAFGLGLTNPDFSVTVRYQYFEGKWYPENFQWIVDFKMTKRHMFSQNEISQFKVEQLLKVSDVKLADCTEIDKELRYNPKEAMAKQVHPAEGVNWAEVNTLSESRIDEVKD